MPAPQVSVDSTVLSLEGTVEPAMLASTIRVLMKFSVGSVEVPVSLSMLFPQSLVDAFVLPALISVGKDCRSAHQQTCERKSCHKSF
jgi:hypothetical protein